MLKNRWVPIVAAGLTLCPATTATAAEPGSSPPPAPGDVTVTGKRLEQDRRVCVSDVTTGSIMPKTICRTKGEWEEQRQRGLAAIQRLKDDRDAQRHTRDSLENR